MPCCASGSTSPAVKNLMPAMLIKREMLVLFMEDPSPGTASYVACGSIGHKTRISMWPIGASKERFSPCNALLQILPMLRPFMAPCNPPLWSAWLCVITNHGIELIRRDFKQVSMRTGSGPVSMTMAWWAPRFITSASPCPTSQFTILQLGPGQVKD